MTSLADKLADLSLVIGDIEARSEAFGKEQQIWRDEKIAVLQKSVNATRDLFSGQVQSKRDNLTSAWNDFQEAMKERDLCLHRHFEESEHSVELNQANELADRLEANAEYAISLAKLAIEEAELSTAKAIDARIRFVGATISAR